MPHFRHHFGHPPSGPDFYPTFGQSSDVISSRKRGHFGDTWIAQDFQIICEKTLGNLSPSGESLFGALIAAKNAPFSASFRQSRLIFTQNLTNPQMRLDPNKRGHFGDTWISQDPPKILEKSRAIYRHLGGPYFEP